MTGGVAYNVFDTRAAGEAVCGDGAIDPPELCDDGNLQNGDGCSSICTLEQCGNGTIDAGEQCDDGNGKSGDGCSAACFIEFCGDQIVQPSVGEQCDDGNGIAGDGCTNDCKSEATSSFSSSSFSSSSSSSSFSSPSSSLPSSSSFLSSPTFPPTKLPTEAEKILIFLQSPAATDFLTLFSAEEQKQLFTLLQKITAGKALTQEERAQADIFILKLSQGIDTVRTTYSDLLRTFVSTSISETFLGENSMQTADFFGNDIASILKTLEKNALPMTRQEIQAGAESIIGDLKKQGMNLFADAPASMDIGSIRLAKKPLEAFLILKTMKELTEQHASKDIPASLKLIQAETRILKDFLPLLQEEFTLNPTDIQPLLDAIDRIAADGKPDDIDRLVAAINRLLMTLERHSSLIVTDRSVLAKQTEDVTKHTVEILQDTGRADELVTPQNIATIVETLSATAPTNMKPAFEHGTMIDQRIALLQFIEKDTQTQLLRDILRSEGTTTFDTRYATLREDIARIGTADRPETTCDDSVSAALRCTHTYLSDLQDAVRGRSAFSRFIGTLQDYFNIEQ